MRTILSLALATALTVPASASAQGAPPAATAPTQPSPPAATAPPAPVAPAPAPTTTVPSPDAPAAPTQPQPRPPEVVYQPPPPPPPPPRADDEWWTSVRPRERSGAKIPLAITGSVFAGLGMMTLMAAGITWLTAWGESRELEDKCYSHKDSDGDPIPPGYCVKGTAGGDAYERTRDSALASQILVGVAFPLMASGLAMTIISVGLHGERDELRYAARLKTTGQGLVLEGSF